MFCTGCKDGIRWRCLETFESQDCLWSVFWDGEKCQDTRQSHSWGLGPAFGPCLGEWAPRPLACSDTWHERQTLFYYRVIIQECGAIVLIIWPTRKYFEVLIRKVFWCEQKAYCHQGYQYVSQHHMLQPLPREMNCHRHNVFTKILPLWKYFSVDTSKNISVNV